MRTYYTEETVSTVQRTYIKAMFRAKYHAERQDDLSHHTTEYYDLHLYEAELVITDIQNEDFTVAKDLTPFGGSLAQPVNCYDLASGEYFQLNMEGTRISDARLSDVTKEGSERFGQLSGILYGYTSKILTEKIQVTHTEDEPVAAPVNDWSGWTRTSTHEFKFSGGARYRRDHYRGAGNTWRWGNWYGVPSGSCSGSIFRWGLGGLLLLFLVRLSWPGLIILGFLFLIFLISRIFRTGFRPVFFSLFYGLFALFYIGGIAVLAFRSVAGQGTVYRGRAPVSRAAMTVRRQPVRRHAVHTHDQPDEWIIHHRAWIDMGGSSYEGDVRVLASAYRKARAENSGLGNISGLPDVYRAMCLADAPRLGGVYALFDSLRTARHPDSLQFAHMLVSFVQDIPYSKVTDGDCKGGGPDNFSTAEGAGNLCIGNIPYGVQSPVEFMANFQGDCDTRTLFLFTLLNHYHYKVAMLGSEVFRHSLLGLALPLPGASKMAGTDRYVLWETTSKSFAPGQLSPAIDHMDYWNFNLINNNPTP